MRSILKALLQTPCREHDITDNDRDSFSAYLHLQRYFPALDLFKIPEPALKKIDDDDIISLSSKNMEFPTKYSISQWISQDKPKFWTAIRTTLDKDGEPVAEECTVFTKIVHLLNPIDIIKEKYNCPAHPLLPQSEKTWKNTLYKLHSHNNQAYVDAVANYVLSRFRELDLTPHCILSYGSFTGISKLYQYTITNEYDTYRQCRWFWNGMQTHSAKLVVLNGDQDVSTDPEFEEVYREIITCPFEDDEDIELDATINSEIDNSDLESMQSFTFDNIEEDTDTPFELSRKNMSRRLSESSNESEESDESDGSDESEESDGSEESDVELDICLQIPNMPIICISQEAQEGVMDVLTDEDELDGYERGSQGWEARWIAWIFQVIAALTFLQRTICFTHNDLHSNNILWRKTEKKYLYYRVKDGTVWRVPTYGKIFSIIDFGRAIFRLGKRLWISDDHWPDQDAGDQYNFGPFFDPSLPKVTPNPSFDLCRLSVSLIDGLFDEPPSKKKGKGVPIMSEEESEEGSWKVYETKSPLYNLLWSWMVNDAGATIYATENGEEKYEGFDLYIRIAQDVHSAVPKDQLHKPIFQTFLWKNAVPQEESIYSLGI